MRPETVALAEIAINRIETALDSAGTTRLSLATATGIPVSTLRRRMKGHGALDIDQLERIATTLGYEVEAFVLPEDEWRGLQRQTRHDMPDQQNGEM
ncbi:helix-turn-helix transcriptional regulator [Antrihabitans sp. YC3-6]|uniref:Helix-turn-helix transcriptional regulator n=1 Tax=Antrihabitans stalagmiti TaxID=2799499 RepID=A0A934NR88_9NOCA|nr:helix-turn-helix transcriptional regulator [Antrihabitans stalagmiti]